MAYLNVTLLCTIDRGDPRFRDPSGWQNNDQIRVKDEYYGPKCPKSDDHYLTCKYLKWYTRCDIPASNQIQMLDAYA